MQFRRMLLFISVSIITFAIYANFAAPSVTFEDSGELLVAAYYGGIAHPPGYPFYLILLKIWLGFAELFTSNIAFAGNLFSGFCMALSSGIFVLIAVDLTRDLKVKSEIKILIAILGCITYALSSQVLRQSLIVEVYGLHNLIVACIIYLILKLKSELRPQPYLWFWVAVLLGLGMANHHLTLVLGFCYLAYLVVTDMPCLKRIRFWMLSITGFIVGLIPYAYFWVSIQIKPIFSWGNIKSFQEFVFHITRSQYAPHIERESELAIHQQIAFLQLTWNNFGWILFISIAGLIYLYRKKEISLIFWSILLIGLGPLTAFLINFMTLQPTELLQQDVYSLISVFFLPFYFVVGLLIVTGITRLFNWILNFPSHHRLGQLLSFLMLCLPVFHIVDRSYQSIQIERKDKYLAPHEFYQNIELITDKDKKIVLLTNWDPFSFPIFYLQMIENKFPNLIVIDLEMLKAPWYLEMIKSRYPEMIGPIEPFFNNHLDSQTAYVLYRKTSDKQVLFYTSFVNKFVESLLIQGTPVFLSISRDFTRLPIGLLTSFQLTPNLVATRISQPGQVVSLTEVPDLKFTSTNKDFKQHDRMTLMFQSYYRQLLVETQQALDAKQTDLNQKINDLLVQFP